MGAHLLSSRLVLVPTAFWAVCISILIFSLLPTSRKTLVLPLLYRGKLIQPSSSPPWFTVPQRLFLHFYVVGTVFNGFLLLLMLAHILVKPIPNFQISIQEAWRAVAILFLFELHVLRRLYETSCVSKFSRDARMHVLVYLLTPLFYVMVPLTLFPRAIELMVNFWHGYQPYKHGIYKSEISFQGGNPLLQLGWHYWIGGAIFVWGWVHQYRCHTILASLRTNPKEDGQYKIPYGDWFEYVSSAHYLAEFVIYFSFIVATGGQDVGPWLLFAITVVNLSISADVTHKWYKRKFENYPPSRKAVIPFLY